MNKLTITIVTTLLLTVSGMALAQDFYGGPGNKGQQRGMQGMPMIQGVVRGLRNLDLEDEQRDNIQAIMQDLRAETAPVMQKTRALHLQLRELVKADVYDEDAVAALAVQEGDFAAERLMITSRALSEVFSQLTQEQRDELATMIAERQQWRAERQKQRPGQS